MISLTQRPLPDNAQYSQETNIHPPSGIRARIPSKTAAVAQRLRPHGHYVLYTSDYLINNLPSTSLFSEQSLFDSPNKNFYTFLLFSHIWPVISSIDTPFYYAVFLPAWHFVLVPCAIAAAPPNFNGASLSLSLLGTTVGLAGSHRQYYGSCSYSTTLDRTARLPGRGAATTECN
jgi:hypothetical protein